MASLYPLFAQLAGRFVLVVGGGPVAARKANALLACGAGVIVIAPELNKTLQRQATAGRIRHAAAAFTPEWLDEVWLVIAATDDRDLNRRVSQAAEERKLWVNVVDDGELSSFHVPAIVRRGPLAIAISSAGQAPALARNVRARLEASLDDSFDRLAQLLARYRQRIRQRFRDIKARRSVYDEWINGEVAALVRTGRLQAAEKLIRQQLRGTTVRRRGGVALIGAGPGSAGLLTLAGLRRLQEADVILHDRLVSADVLALARRDAERINVGKQPGGRGVEQAAINKRMVRLARAGYKVVRLKGGDPLIFARGGEELQYLRRYGIPYEIVPGITAAHACAAYAGIPLTHRDHARSVRFITAHCKASLDLLDWPSLARDQETLAVYMGVSQLRPLRDRLIEHGRDPLTPVALVENGTLASQRVITATLTDLPEVARAHKIAPPAMIFLGGVAAFADSLAWYDAASYFNLAGVAA